MLSKIGFNIHYSFIDSLFIKSVNLHAAYRCLKERHLNYHKIFRKRKYWTLTSPGQTPGNFNIVVRGVGLEPTKAYARGS